MLFLGAMAAVDDGLRRIRMWNEWGHPWPLWEDGPVSPDDLGIGKPLAARLHAWRARWEHLQDPAIGWTEPTAQDEWEAQGDALFDELQRETRGVAVIVPCYLAAEGW